MLLDYHMHTELTDGSGRPVDYAAVAVKRGLTEMGCSDHAPLAGRETNWTMRVNDLPTYVRWVEEARAAYPGLTIRLGLEVDYQPGCENWVRELAAMYPWDYFLGSVHFIGDWPVDASAKDWEGHDVQERWRAYFQLWREAARSGLYDSLAHPDLPKKFNKRPATDFSAVYRESLQAVAASGVAIEVSTGGLRKPCREIYPSRAFLMMAREWDIPVTMGSDAHLPDETGQDFEQAVALLQSCGYDRVCRFERRQRELVSLG